MRNSQLLSSRKYGIEQSLRLLCVVVPPGMEEPQPGHSYIEYEMWSSLLRRESYTDIVGGDILKRGKDLSTSVRSRAVVWVRTGYAALFV